MGEVGSLPSVTQLFAIVSELARCDCPGDYGYDGLFMCVFCESRELEGEHLSECLWRRAQELVGTKVAQ